MENQPKNLTTNSCFGFMASQVFVQLLWVSGNYGGLMLLTTSATVFVIFFFFTYIKL